MVYRFDYDPEYSRRLGLGTLGTVVFVEIGLAIGGGFGPCFVPALVLTPGCAEAVVDDVCGLALVRLWRSVRLGRGDA